MAKHKLIVSAFGGGGYNVVNKVVSELEEISNALPELVYHFVDTKEFNGTEPLRGDYYRIVNTSNSGAVIEGSAGDRRTNATEIMSGVQKFLDEKKYTKRVTGEFHLACFSAGGGSGSVAGLFYVEGLLKKGIPVVVMLIGDSSDVLKAKNNLNVIATLNHYAIKYNRAISVIYVNNDTVLKSNNPSEKEARANELLRNSIITLATFLSATNEELDTQDMINFLDQSNYSTIQVKPGLYSLYVAGKSLENTSLQNAVVSSARILTTKDQDYDLPIKVLQYKRGYLVDPDLIEVMGDNTPIYMFNVMNLFETEQDRLKQVIEEGDEYLNSMASSKIEADKSAELDSDTGMFL